MSLSLAHYFLALIYSGRQIKQLQKQLHERAIFPLVLLAVAGATIYLTQFSLLIYFVIHHIFSEIYLLKDRLALKGTRTTTHLFTVSVALNLLIYLVILRHNADLNGVSEAMLFVGLFVAYATFAVMLAKLRHTLNRTQLIDLCVMELALLPFIIASFWYEFVLLHVVCYHVIFWLILPISKMPLRPATSLNKYIAINVILTGLFLAVSPIGIYSYPLDGSEFMFQMNLWAYIHITLSVALSNANPTWLIRYFRPQALNPGHV